MEVYFEAIKTLNSFGVQKVETVNGRTNKIFVRACHTREEAEIVADKKNKELTQKQDQLCYTHGLNAKSVTKK